MGKGGNLVGESLIHPCVWSPAWCLSTPGPLCREPVWSWGMRQTQVLPPVLDLVIYPWIRESAFIPSSFLLSLLREGIATGSWARKQGQRALHRRKGKQGVRDRAELSPVPLGSLTCQPPIDGVVTMVRLPVTHYRLTQALHPCDLLHLLGSPVV